MGQHPPSVPRRPFADRRIYVGFGRAYGRGLMRLGRADFATILDFLAGVDKLGLEEPYAAEVLEGLRALVPCDEIGFQAADLEARRFLDRSSPESEEDDAVYWAVGPCPIMDYRARTSDLTAVRMSDLIGRSRYHELPVYREYFEPMGLDHILDLGLSARRQSYSSVILLRGRDVPDFSERDRLVLELLRPQFRAREARAAIVAALSRNQAAGEEDQPSPESSLTTREREILAMVAEGKTNGVIAAELWVAPATVKKHLENVYVKLGVGSRAAAASRAQATSAAV